MALALAHRAERCRAAWGRPGADRSGPYQRRDLAASVSALALLDTGTNASALTTSAAQDNQWSCRRSSNHAGCCAGTSVPRR
jgi:hypothetical protein